MGFWEWFWATFAVAFMLMYVGGIVGEFIWHPWKDWRRKRQLLWVSRYGKRMKRLALKGRLAADKVEKLTEKNIRIRTKLLRECDKATRQATGRRKDPTEAGPPAREGQDPGGSGAGDDAGKAKSGR